VAEPFELHSHTYEKGDTYTAGGLHFETSLTSGLIKTVLTGGRIDFSSSLDDCWNLGVESLYVGNSEYKKMHCLHSTFEYDSY
jgi:hypothetical protein